MKWKQILAIVLISASTTGVTMWGYNHFSHDNTYVYQKEGDTGKIPANYAGFNGVAGAAGPADFAAAADAAIPATVHIKTKATRQVSNNLPRNNPFGNMFPDLDLDDFFGGDKFRSIPQMASGSGAIISEDGYIVTNSHVVEGADDITVTLTNKKSFKAKLISSDRSSDLAVIKIDAKGLPFLLYSNSDDVKVGQWVLAVGYPLTLETTVTAGIVSAKGRTLDINRRQSDNPVESFIQTDAAVNPGNSGGPLVNTEGKLVGINSAIASPTGAYAGYSFTIPVNIVKKIVSDLIKFGTVQRAYLGIEYPKDNISDEEKRVNNIKDDGGVYVMTVREGGAAAAAGIKKGDIITKINNMPVVSGADLIGQIATYRPGDKITLTYQRAGKEITSTILLKNLGGNTDIVKNDVMDKLGAELKTLPKEDAKELNIKGGVIVKVTGTHGAFSKVRIGDNYVVVKANGKEVTNVEELKKILEGATGTVKLEGIYPGFEGVYPIVINLDNAN